MGAVRPRAPLVACLLCVFAASLTGCSKPSAPDIPLLEPGLWTFEIETSREGKPVETRTIRDCVGVRGLYSADRPEDCSVIESWRSVGGRALIVEIDCKIPARRPRDTRIVEARGRGPLDFANLETRITSRSEFTGDLRRNFLRDNVTVYEAPPDERQTTRRITRAAWLGASCPADLPPDDFSRWFADAIDEPTTRDAGEIPARPDGNAATLAERPQMRTGLWQTRMTTVIDGGPPATETVDKCLRYPRKDTAPVPVLLPSHLCMAVAQVEAVQTPSGIVTSTRCQLPSYRIMSSDLQFETPPLDISSRSEIKGDFSKRLQVRHVTDVVYASGRQENIRADMEITRLGDCRMKSE
jgi:hypothetical protein